MVKTRAKKVPKQDTTSSPNSITPRYPPLKTDRNPPKLFILPRNRSRDSRFITLINPAILSRTRYLYCPETGLSEIKEISYPRTQPRSWLIEPTTVSDANATSPTTQLSSSREGWVLETPSLFVSTAVDPLFLLLPVLHSQSTSSETGDRNSIAPSHFLTIDDHFDTVTLANPDYKLLINSPAIRSMVEKRASAICDDVNVGDEKMYRLSIGKLAHELMKKARRMFAQSGKLPPSLEERFVTRPLEAPMTSIVTHDPAASATPAPGADASSLDEKENLDPLNPASKPSPPSAIQSTPTSTASAETTSLLRLRTALTFLLHSYIPPSLHTPLQTQFSALTTFTPLDTHLAHLASLKREAAAVQALNTDSNVFAPKRSWSNANEDGEGSFESRAEKKRKVEREKAEEERKKGSRGLRELRKVDVGGMKKMSSFFGKKS